MAIVSSYLIYVLWKTEFQVVYIRLPALVCSILNVVDTVRTVKVLYWTSASVYGMFISVYWRASRCIYCIGGCFKFACRLFVCLRVCSELVMPVLPFAWNNSAPTGRIFMKFDILVFCETLLRKSKFHYNLTRITGTLHEELFTIIISRLMLFRMGNVSDKRCLENQNAHLMFRNFDRKSYRL